MIEPPRPLSFHGPSLPDHPEWSVPLGPPGLSLLGLGTLWGVCEDWSPKDGSWVMDYVIFDLATLRYRFGAHRASVSALAPTGELLAVVDLAPHHSDREAAFLAADAALRTGRVVRSGHHVRVALYNPYTADVCVGPVPTTKVYCDRQPLVLAPEGLLATLDETGLCVSEDRTLGLFTPTLASTSRKLLAHQLGD